MEDLELRATRCAAVGRLSVAAHGRRLAAASVLRATRSMPFADAPVPGTCSRNEDAAGELRRAHHPALDAEIPPHRQRLQHHPQQVHALRETVHGLPTWPAADSCAGARHAGQREIPARAGRAAGRARVAPTVGLAGLHTPSMPGAGKSDAGARSCGTWPSNTPTWMSRCAPCRYPHRMRGVGSNCPAACSRRSKTRAKCARRRCAARKSAWPRPRRYVKDEEAEQAIRTIICRSRSGPALEAKDRWHPLYTTSDAEALAAHEVLSIFSALRQEPRARPSRRGARPDGGCGAVWLRQGKPVSTWMRPRSGHRGPFANDRLAGGIACTTRWRTSAQDAGARTMSATTWAPCAANFSTDRAEVVRDVRGLDCARWTRSQARTELLPLIDELNASNPRLPWLDNRRLVMSLARPQATPEQDRRVPLLSHMKPENRLVLGMPYPLLWGILTATLRFVPYVGTWLS